jgi:PKD repeat protein
VPQGLAVNPSTGVITGVPAEAGTYAVSLTASNDAGTGTKELSIVVAPPLLSLVQALDSVTSRWVGGGDAPWFAQNAITQDGVDAAQSGPLTHSEESTVETQITEPTVVSFRWRVSSEQDFDVLAFLIDDVVQATVSGITNWEERSFTVPPGRTS